MNRPDDRHADDAYASVSNRIEGGVFFREVIMGTNITVHLPPAITPALSGLPAAAPTFTGRDCQVRDLLQSLAPVTTPEQVTPTPGVTGLGGVGKTELAVQVAAQALKQPGWFPGGVLFVDMFGYDNERRLSPEKALDQMLRALGMPGEHIPADLQALTWLYRSVLRAFAEQGQRLLIVIDNASDHGQASPLLPTDGVNRALVTSRETLGLLGARFLELGVLDLPDATVLLHRALTEARPTDSRVTDHPDDAAAIARLCGGLPLALRITAALLAEDPARPLAALAEDLQDEHCRLDELSYVDTAVRAAFDLSYRRLPAEEARLFRLLPVNPGPDISTEATAALVQGKRAVVRRRLEALARSHLIERGASYGRWRMHDLVRLFAEELSSGHADSLEAGGRGPAFTSLLDYYLSTAQAACAHLDPKADFSTGNGFPDRDDALRWLDWEYPNLSAVAFAAHNAGRMASARDLPLTLERFLDWRRHFHHAITLQTMALEAAQELEDDYGQTRALNALGCALREVRRVQEAVTAHRRAARMCQVADDPFGEAVTLANLGNSLQAARQFEEAVTVLEAATLLFQELGEVYSYGMTMGSLGNALSHMQRFEEAIHAHRLATQICKDQGDRLGEGMMLGNLGNSLRRVGRFEEALEAHQEDVRIAGELGDHGGGRAWANLGLALEQAERFDEAASALERSLQLLRETDDRHGQSMALGSLGNVLFRIGRSNEAISSHREAAEICRDLGDRHGEAMAMTNLASALRRVGEFEEAVTLCRPAVQAFRELADRPSEGIALNNLGFALDDLERWEESIPVRQRALELFRELGDGKNEGAAVTCLGMALVHLRRFKEAIVALQPAVQFSRRAADRHSEGMLLGYLADALREEDRLEEAVSVGRATVRVFRELGDRENEGAALTNLGIALGRSHRFDEAVTACASARQIFRDTGDRHNEEKVLLILRLLGAGG
ncbi:tetratricopeptide repeat protein [Streptomyces sp. ISL-44]|uniref:tetratricopeptide repeat protein n=1 Tax=Streptomyces sp. ISL-44 TaxID=2819184 RepID=UPI001BE97BC6|nr:tetratricopeptide repeat protein [Streptomyces sp. ISL-44]MBT2542881.1 tetratricopeptide repeat protein [Streptomyces sp. ISL-44]